MDNVEIRFSGSGGQGLILSAKILAAALVEEGNNVAQSQSYEPVSRGGLSRSDLVVTKGEAAYPLSSGLDILMILDGAAVNGSDLFRYRKRLYHCRHTKLCQPKGQLPR